MFRQPFCDDFPRHARDVSQGTDCLPLSDRCRPPSLGVLSTTQLKEEVRRVDDGSDVDSGVRMLTNDEEHTDV